MKICIEMVTSSKYLKTLDNHHCVSGSEVQTGFFVNKIGSFLSQFFSNFFTIEKQFLPKFPRKFKNESMV